MAFKVVCQVEDESDPKSLFCNCLKYVNLAQVVYFLVLRPFGTAFLVMAASAIIIIKGLKEKLSGLRQAHYTASDIRCFLS